MRRVFILTTIGFLAGLIGFTPSYAGAGPAQGDAQIKVAQRKEREKTRTKEPKATGEKAAAVKQDAQEWLTAWQGLSPEDQAALTQAWSTATEKVKDLTPEQKQKIKQAGQQLAQKLKNLSPEQKAALQQQLQKAAQTYASLTAEQKQAMLTAMAGAIEKMGNLSSTVKGQLQANYQKLLSL